MKSKVSVTLDDDLIKKAKKEAEQEGRTLSNWLNQLLKKNLK